MYDAREHKLCALWQPGGLEGAGREVGEGFRWEGLHACLWPIHADAWQRPSQYCKAIILQLKLAIFLNEKKSKEWKKEVLWGKKLRETDLWVRAGFFLLFWTTVSMNTVLPPSRVHSSCWLKHLWMFIWEVVTLWGFQSISPLEYHLGQTNFSLQKHSGWTSVVRHVKPDRDCV